MKQLVAGVLFRTITSGGSRVERFLGPKRRVVHLTKRSSADASDDGHQELTRMHLAMMRYDRV